MAKRPAYTLVLIKSDLIARADFGPAPRLAPMGFWRQAQTGNARLFYSLEAALKLGGKCGKSAWVVGEEFWTQTLSLPANALAGLSREQIAKAIGFDVEALTGLSALDSAIGFCKAAPRDESEHLWVTQAPLTARTQVQATIKSAGAPLAGIVHPGGLPEPLDGAFAADESATTWRRIEVWKESTVCLLGRRGEPPRVHVINGDPAQEAWRTNVTRWIAANDAEHSEWLGPQGSMAGRSLDDSGRPWVALPSATVDALKSWLARWAAQLTAGGAPRVPIVEPSRAGARLRRQAFAAAAVLLACTALGVAHGTLLLHQRQMFAQQSAILGRELNQKKIRFAQLETPRHEWDQLQKQIKAVRADLSKRRTDRMAFHAVPDFAVQRHRVDELLGALARHANAGLTIDRISPQQSGQTLIEGRCYPATSVDQFAHELEAALAPVGWEADAAQTRSLQGVASGRFDLSVTPSVEHLAPAEPDEVIPSSSLAGDVK